DFIKVPDALTDSALSIPLIPPQHRPILMYMTATLLSRDKGDNEVGLLNSLTRAKLKAMTKEPAKQEKHMSANRGRIIPRRDLF
ncbi:MAG: hypothetical protein KAR20_12285, partial [Candidatus Heimdallarchaeota archaeon]|nr:hypothetical protein [Candidatus Heimdallarchaeota archaeon]